MKLSIPHDDGNRPDGMSLIPCGTLIYHSTPRIKAAKAAVVNACCLALVRSRGHTISMWTGHIN